MKSVPAGVPKPKLASNPQAYKSTPKAVGRKVGLSGRKIKTAARRA